MTDDEIIAHIIANHTPREMAVMLVQSMRRAKTAEMVLDVFESIDMAKEAALEGDAMSVVGALREAEHRIKGRKF